MNIYNLILNLKQILLYSMLIKIRRYCNEVNYLWNGSSWSKLH